MGWEWKSETDIQWQDRAARESAYAHAMRSRVESIKIVSELVSA
jgi:hypothetical protein